MKRLLGSQKELYLVTPDGTLEVIINNIRWRSSFSNPR